MSLAELRQTANKKLAEYEFADQTLKAEIRNLEQSFIDLRNTEIAQKIFQQAATAVQQEIHGQIQSIVSRCLVAVFGQDTYRFEIRFEQKRGKTEAVLVFTKDEMTYDDPVNQCGGGCVDVASFGLRLVAMVLHRPSLRRLMVMDEPFGKIRGQIYRKRVKALLLELAEELGIQFILNVDASVYPELCLGSVVELE